MRHTDATFELTVRTDRPLFTVIMRPKQRHWSVINYWANGEFASRVDCTPEEFLEVCEKIRSEAADEG